MWKKIVPVGAKVSFSDVVSDIQDYSMKNARDKILPYVKQYGVITKSAKGVATGPEAMLAYQDADGVSLTTGGWVIFQTNLNSVYLSPSAAVHVFNVDTIGNSSPYKLYIQYDVTLSAPADVVQGFFYPAASGYTIQSPAYFLGTVPIATALEANQILLASGITDGSGNLTPSTFYDARQPFILKDYVTDDTTVAFLDRPQDFNGIPTFVSGLVSAGYAYFEGTTVLSGTNVIHGGTITSALYFDGQNALDFTTYDDDGSVGASMIALSGDKSLFLNNKLYMNGQIQLPLGTDNITLYNNAGASLGTLIHTGETPTVPQNFRLFDINPDKYSGSDSVVVLKWNYDDILLSGVNAGTTLLHTHREYPYRWDTAKITGALGDSDRYNTITADSLLDKKLYSPASDTLYTISGNTADTDGTGFEFTIYDGLSSVDAIISKQDQLTQQSWRIVDDADTYILTIQRHPASLNEISDYASNLLAYKQTHLLPQEYVKDPSFNINLPTDGRYHAKLQAAKKFSYSPVTRLNEDYNISSRYYFKNQEFSSAADGDAIAITPTGTSYSRFYFDNTLPLLDTGAGAVTLRSTAFGFDISIVGWYDQNHADSNPHAFEIIYTSNSAPSTWDDVKASNMDSSYTRVVTASRKISINTIEHKTYNVAVWPLQNGSRVASAYAGSVAGGAGGIFPENHVLSNGKYSLRTYQVQGIANNVLQANGLAYSPAPAASGVDIRGLTPDMVNGQVIQRTDTGSEWRIINAYYADGANSQINIETHQLTGTADVAPSGVCYINTTPIGRRFSVSQNLPIDYQLYAASVNVFGGKLVSANSPGIIRISQYGAEDDADYKEISTLPTELTQALDGTIQAYRNATAVNRTLVVDAYDPNGLNNFCNLDVELAIYAQPLVVDREGDRPIPNISV